MRNIIEKLLTLSEPLNINLLAKDVSWNWTQGCSEGCVKTKDLLVSSQVMAHYDPHALLVLAVCASGYGLGATCMFLHTDGMNENASLKLNLV